MKVLGVDKPNLRLQLEITQQELYDLFNFFYNISHADYCEKADNLDASDVPQLIRDGLEPYL